MAELLNIDDRRERRKENLETLLSDILHTTLDTRTLAKDIVNYPQKEWKPGPSSRRNQRSQVFLDFFMSLDNLFLWVLALQGTLVSRLSTVICHITFFSPFTSIVNYLDICELYGHVAASVSHLGDAATVSLFTLTTVIFLFQKVLIYISNLQKKRIHAKPNLNSS
jgi:hypothetical protein